ncbi:MAG: MarR family transcriptional regulator [Bacteroidetes bacterium]|nr:MarR family transcriptional regulator [Bacteroidota bacterium]MCW5896077.1 MarR family transcriptional regulator [Bacteroidota bacterium]
MRTTKRYGKKADAALTLWVKLARAFSVFSKATGEDIEGYGLTQAQFGVLECLGHLGPMTMGQLCRKKLVSGGNMTVVVDNLEKLSLVERVHSTKDRRAITLQLTVKGKKLFEEIFPKHAKHVGMLASALSTEEQAQLGKLLKKLGLSLREPK